MAARPEGRFDDPSMSWSLIERAPNPDLPPRRARPPSTNLSSATSGCCAATYTRTR